MSVEELDWNSDPWFARTVSSGLTEGFKQWWVGFYKTPFEYPETPDEQHEYWVRCAFAFMGWKGRNGEI